MYNSILVPLDSSKLAENILTEVEELAVLLNAKLNLIYVRKVHVLPVLLLRSQEMDEGSST